MSWKDDAVVATTPRAAFEQDQVVSPAPAPRRAGSGAWDALVAGYQGSATGLAMRGRLPDVVLDASHAKWYEKAAQGISSTVSDVPEMAVGFALGGAAGAALGGTAGSAVPVVGTAAGAAAGGVLGAGAGAFALPTAIRESLIQAYEAGEAHSSADFLSRAGIVIKETGKSAAVGALTLGVGGLVARGVGGAVAPLIGEEIGVKAATRAIGAAQTAAEIGTMTVAPAALEGKLPDPQDFVNAAIVVGGLKGAGYVAGKMAQIYARTGVEPEQVVADAKADPKIAEELKAEGDGIPKAYDPIAEAEMLREALPEAPKVAEVMANPTGTITAGKEPNHINYRYTESAEDVQSLRAKIAETFKSEIEEARGKESWDATQSKAEEIIRNRLAGMSDDQKAELSKMSFSDLAAQSMAVEAMAQKAAFNAREAASEIARKGDAATPEDMQRLAASIEQSALLHAVDQQNGAEIGRALNSRKAARQRGELAQAMTETLAQYGEDPHVLARMVLGLHTTAALTKFAALASKATTFEKVVEAWKAGILSGPITHAANIVGNGTFAALRPIVDLTAAAVGRIANMDERVAAAEPFARIFGNLQGAKDALVFAGEALTAAYGEGGLRGLAKQIAIGKEDGKAEQFRKAIEGTKGDIIRLPFRALSLADDFFKIVSDQGERYALATRQATEENFNLLSREFRERVVDLVQNDAKIAAKGEAAALRFTFNTPLGEKGQAVQNLVKKWNAQLLVPFIRTPANIFKEMIRLTPLAPAIKEWRTAWDAGGAERAKAVSEVAMGTAISGVVVSYVANGGITGAGPADANKRQARIDAGWQPYSVKVGGKYYSYQRLQPVGTLMGMAADLSEVWMHVTEEEGNKAATMLSVAFANAVTQQTFLSGITSVVQVLADPQRYGPRFAQQYAGSVIPAAVAQPTAMADPLQREINSLIDAVKARVPGLRQTLEPRINLLTGEPMQAQERVGEVAPIQTSEKSEDPVLSEAMRLGVGVAKAPKAVELPAFHQHQIGEVKLTPEQRTMFAQGSGRLTHEAMAKVIDSDIWETLPDLVKKRVFEQAIEAGRKVGRAEALGPEQRAAEAQRIAEQIGAKMVTR